MFANKPQGKELSVMKQSISHLLDFLKHPYFEIEDSDSSIHSELDPDSPTYQKDIEITFLKLFIKDLVLFIKSFISNPFDSKSNHEAVSDDEPYRAFKIDAPPIIKEREIYDYEQLIKQHELNSGKPFKPVNNRKPKQLNYEGSCPHCNAPADYIYENNIQRAQLQCKVCRLTFTMHKPQHKDFVLLCPHCSKTLSKIKQRNEFDIYKCINDHCHFYLSNLDGMTAKQKERFKYFPHEFKVRYIYRTFDLDLPDLEPPDLAHQGHGVQLSRIHKSMHVLGLALSYYITYGLSLRKTSAIMMDIHQISISHQTVANYAQASACVIEPFVENYDYELSEDLTGDETYVKIKGKKSYVFFISDKVKKIITSYRVFRKRDVGAAIKAIYQTIKKFKEIPDNLKFVFDGNPIYQLAHMYFALKDINFDLFQVIGLSNNSETDKLFRPFKQVTERLNRSFKSDHYLTMNGFNSDFDANCYMVLFAANFNFLRPHKSLDYEVPVIIPQILSQPHLPAKWLKLIDMSYHSLR